MMKHMADLLLALPGVVKANYKLNRKMGTVEFTVWGGDRQKIAETILFAKGAGIKTLGNTEVDMTYDDEHFCTIRFNHIYRVT